MFLEKKNSSSGALVLHKTSNLIISRLCQDKNGKEMYQNARTARAELLFFLIKPIVMWRFCSCRRRLFLRFFHAYPDIFDSATFPFRIQKYSHPHIAYSNRICPSALSGNVPGLTLVLRTPQGNRGNKVCAIK